MLDLPFCRNGVILGHSLSKIADRRDMVAAPHLTLNGHRCCKNTLPSLAEHCQQGRVLELSYDPGANRMGLKPLIQDLAEHRILHRQEKWSACETVRESLSIELRKRRRPKQRNAARAQQMVKNVDTTGRMRGGVG